MDSSVNQLLAEMEKAAQTVARLEAELQAAKAKGKDLFKEFQKRQSDLALKFGVSGETAATGRRSRRQPRSLESRIMTSVTRMVNALEKEGVAVREAKAKLLEAALGVARKNGADSVPTEVVKTIDARLKDFGKK